MPVVGLCRRDYEVLYVPASVGQQVKISAVEVEGENSQLRYHPTMPPDRV